MREKATFYLNIIAIFSFICYVVGIYLQVEFQGIVWGNLLVFSLIFSLGTLFGVITVVFIGALALIILYKWQRMQVINVFFCWFFILSLYQCAINSFLQFNGLPDEPINQFFKFFFPDSWYPAKEIAFTLVSILLTYVWVKKVSEKKLQSFDVIFIVLISVILIIFISLSQFLLIN